MFSSLTFLDSFGRMPIRHKAFRTACQIELEVQPDSPKTQYTLTNMVYEHSREAFITVVRSFVKAVSEGSLNSSTPGVGPVPHLYAFAVQVAFARLYARPESTLIRVRIGRNYPSYFWQVEFVQAGSIPEVDEIDFIAQDMTRFTNVYDAYQASIAWVRAPWGADVDSPIEYKADASLPVFDAA